MALSRYKFLDPHVLAAIGDLEIVARTVVDGFLLGMHQSPKIGAGLEFSQYRSYEPGDDLRRVDWKMYARSDRYYVRDSEIESSIAIHFLLDASASMLHEDRSLRKFDYARMLIASLAYLAHQQGDAISLFALNDQQEHMLLPRAGKLHLHRLLHLLDQVTPQGVWPGWPDLENLFNAFSGRRLLVVISDLHEPAARDDIRTALKKLAALNNEVLLLHLMARNELDFSYEGFLTFEDLESGERIQADAARLRKQFQAQQTAYLDATRRAMHEHNIRYAMFATDQPLDQALRTYLSQRARTA